MNSVSHASHNEGFVITGHLRTLPHIGEIITNTQSCRQETARFEAVCIPGDPLLALEVLNTRHGREVGVLRPQGRVECARSGQHHTVGHGQLEFTS